MPPLVILAVLCGALLHATWNALIKGAPHKLFNMGLVAGGAGFAAIVLLLGLPAPATASWPFIATSSVLQTGYYFLLAAVYGVLDMSQAYPIMRGSAPFLVALASGPLMGERLPAYGWGGVLLISGGVVGIAFSGKSLKLPEPAAMRFAMFNAVLIAVCTLLDSVGARRSGAPLTYAAWIFFLAAFPMPVWLAIRNPGFLRYARQYWFIGAIGGMATLLSYGIALWAMTKAPVASVAALRESSILFAGAISALILKEKVGWRRALASGVIAAGVAVMRFV